EISKRLVTRHAARFGENVTHGQFLRLCNIAGEQQLANTWDGRSGFGIVSVAIGLAVPDRLLVQLEAIQTRHTEDHRAEPPIADWKRIRPLRRGLSEVQCARTESSFRVRLERVQAGDDAAIADERCRGSGSGKKVSSGDSGSLMFHRCLLFSLLHHRVPALESESRCSKRSRNRNFAVAPIAHR